MKNLLLITADFPYGESERSFLSSEFDELQKHFQIHIVALENSQDQVKYPMPQEVRYDQCHIDKKWKRVLRLTAQISYREVRGDLSKALKKPGNPVNKGIRLIRTLVYSESAEEIERQLDKIVRAEKIDLIYTYWCTPATIAALRLKEKYTHLKVLTRFHGYDLFEERTEANWQCLRDYIAENCDQLVFVSEQGQKYFLERWGESRKEKSQVSYLGCRRMTFIDHPQNDRLKIISCSNLIPLKRVELIIAALVELPEDFQVEWHHFGDGISRENCEKNARDLLDGSENIQYKFWGAVPNNELENIYKEINPDVFITTSSSEGLPVSVMEASAMGIPAIATDVGGTAEIIKNEKNGFLLSQDPSPKEIAAAIVNYTTLSNENKSEMRRQTYRIWQESFDAQRDAEKFVQKLEKLVTK